MTMRKFKRSNKFFCPCIDLVSVRILCFFFLSFFCSYFFFPCASFFFFLLPLHVLLLLPSSPPIFLFLFFSFLRSLLLLLPSYFSFSLLFFFLFLLIFRLQTPRWWRRCSTRGRTRMQPSTQPLRKCLQSGQPSWWRYWSQAPRRMGKRTWRGSQE